VILRTSEIPLRVESEQRSIHQIHHVFRVEHVNGDWLWVVAGPHSGWVKRGDVLEWDEALDYYTDIIRRHPKAAWAYQGRGVIWRDRQEPEIALIDLDQAVRLEPRLASALADRGVRRARRS
jgi:tetratricopeptide (TPR) repeat protein